MTIEAVNQFLGKVSEDQKLRDELSQAMTSKSDRQAAAKVAAKHGYNFTPEELGTQIKEIKSFQNRQAANQLSEEELEAVAGVFCTPATATIAATVGEVAAVGTSLAIEIFG